MENNKCDDKRFSRYIEILEDYDAEHRFRTIPADRSDSISIDLTSNDYLGIGANREMFNTDFNELFPKASFSSSASRLLSRLQTHHDNLEQMLGRLYGKEIILFNSGYHANVGTIQALNITGTVFLCDKLIHASMIDGLSLSGAEYRRWRHNDLSSLEKLLQKYSDKERCIVVVESIYSMDGDETPLRELVLLKHRYPNMILYVDEAHAFGVRGNKGLGISEEYNLIEDVDILIGTFGKATASSGAFVATNPILRHFLINCARSFIFSTAIPPVNMAWTTHILHYIVKMNREREHLMRISARFRKGIEEITGERNVSTSQIVPLILGDAKKALHLSARLSTRGIDTLPIRRPTVPEGSERIRFSLSAALSESQIEHILNIIREELNDF